MAPPFHPPDRLPAGLCIFGLTYACGLTWAGTEKANPRPLAPREVIERAAADGLSWVELPVRMMDASPEGPAELRRFAEERGIRFVVAGGNLLNGLDGDLRVARPLGAPTLRCTLSTVLCGDRRGFPGGWKEHLRACAAELERLLPLAEELRVAIAVENHQDADSEDLLALCSRFESPYLGVTLDTGNPLAVMEHPLRFAERIAKYLRHLHLKDYRIHPAPNGYRLVRCALGEGVIPFREILALADAQELPVTRSLEMAALNARLIPFLEPSWWEEFSARDARDTLPALEMIWRNLRPADEDYRTPLEQEAEGPALLAYEWRQHEAALAHLRGLCGR